MNASNDDYMLVHGLCEYGREFYPLYEFNSKEYEVIDLIPTVGEKTEVFNLSPSGERKLEGTAKILKIYCWNHEKQKAHCKVLFEGETRAVDRWVDTN